MANDRHPALTWSGRVPLRWRILAVNIFVVGLLAGGLFYLDSYRSRLVEREQAVLARDASILSRLITTTASAPALIAAFTDYARISEARVRIYTRNGRRIFDSFDHAPATYVLRNPADQAWQRHAARAMDRAIDWLIGAPVPPLFREPLSDRSTAWPEISAAQQSGEPSTRYRLAPDRTPVLSAAQTVSNGNVVLITSNPRRVTSTVRAERLDWLLVLAFTLILSVLLSRFLARTIAEPLRQLAHAALRVRLGRERDVVVPRLPERRDEIGQLARTISDMTSALRDRIDAGERFAADVTHELKNPLASLRSALETVERVQDPALTKQLISIANEDVQRLDRLVSDIADAARLDAQLTRIQFEGVDMGELIAAVIEVRKARNPHPSPDIAFARPYSGVAIVPGVHNQLARVIENLLDNALSFSPVDGVVRLSATCAEAEILIRVEDDGPGIPAAQREDIFRRFHSIRPSDSDFGQHSGLGLAIARTIVEAHDGNICAVDREHGFTGACIEIRLPAAQPC